MMQSLINLKNKKKGFTLVELIVVIAIIGILAAILVPRFMGFTDDARKNAALSEAKNIRAIEETNYTATGSWPTIAVVTSTDPDTSTVTLTTTDATVYTFDGVITAPATGSTVDGSFTYVKNNGATTSKLWKATCDTSGNVTVEQQP